MEVRFRLPGFAKRGEQGMLIMRFIPVCLLFSMIFFCAFGVEAVAGPPGGGNLHPVHISQKAATSPAVPAPVRRSYFLELYIVHILVLLAVLTALSEAAERRFPADIPRIRNFWNWILLAAFGVCVVLGFVLLLPPSKSIKGHIINIHCWSGTVGAWAAFYHFIKRFRRMLPAA